MEIIDRAIALHCAGDLEQAESVYRQIIEADSSNFDALHLLGNVHTQRGEFEQAEKLIRMALELDPNVPQCLFNYGLALAGLNRLEDAINSYDRALAITPDDAIIYTMRGKAEAGLGDPDKALASYDQALGLDPATAEAWLGRGDALSALNAWHDAVAAYDKVLWLKPDCVQAHDNRGLAFYRLGRLDDAFASFTRALAADPENCTARFNQCLYLLSNGDFANGWPAYESRWTFEAVAVHDPRAGMDKPRWTGRESVAGKTILLWTEQGFGDTIQFCRYAPMVAALGAKVILNVYTELHELVQSLSGIDRVISEEGQSSADFDYHCPLMSLPLAFATRLDTIPATVPYLTPPSKRIDMWSKRLGKRNRPRVGIAWSTRDTNRSIALEQLLPLRAMGFQLVALQKDITEKDRLILSGHDDILHFDCDFCDTASLIALMDIVISIDTSVAHLAGAMGAPTWLLLTYGACWRWLRERNDSPWYPTFRLFRQPLYGDWDSVTQQVFRELPTWIEQRGVASLSGEACNNDSSSVQLRYPRFSKFAAVRRFIGR